ncbi:MAG TPA: hypothetical protein PK031_09400, partial [Pseudomonadales bacterium]|nr:hypothetical protein [Pseudomonadales bacterium]
MYSVVQKIIPLALLTLALSVAGIDIQNAQAAETPKIKAQRAVTVTRMQKIAAGEMDDIKFVGRVVDQDGNPVPGVEFSYDAIGNGMVPGPGRGTRHAD